MLNYIYLLQIREFVKSNEPIYKIGMTTQKNFNRFRQYPKDSVLLHQTVCNNCKNIEKRLIQKFKNIFKYRKDIGTEYFEGNYKSMIKMIYVEIEKETDDTQYENNLLKYAKNITKDDIKDDKIYTKDDIKDMINGDTTNYTENDTEVLKNTEDIIHIKKINKKSKHIVRCKSKFNKNSIYNINLMTYQCDSCNKQFTTNQSLKYHINKGACKIKCKCDICGSILKTHGRLKTHINKYHSKKGSLISTVQDSIPIDNNNIKNIIINSNNLHAENLKNNKKCNYCSVHFSRGDSLKRHVDKYCKIKKEIELNETNKIAELEKKLTTNDNSYKDITLTENTTNNN